MALIVVLLGAESGASLEEKANCVSRNFFKRSVAALPSGTEANTSQTMVSIRSCANGECGNTLKTGIQFFGKSSSPQTSFQTLIASGGAKASKVSKIGDASAKAFKTAKRTDSHTPSRETPHPIFCFVPSVLPPDAALLFELLLSAPLLAAAEETNALERETPPCRSGLISAGCGGAKKSAMEARASAHKALANASLGRPASAFFLNAFPGASDGFASSAAAVDKAFGPSAASDGDIADDEDKTAAAFCFCCCCDANSASLQLSSNANTERIEFEQFSHILTSSLAPTSSPGFRAFASSRDTAKSDPGAQPCASDKALAMALKAADWTSATKFSSFSSFSSHVSFSLVLIIIADGGLVFFLSL